MSPPHSWLFLWFCYGLPAFVFAIILSSFFEWKLHKSVMHRKLTVFGIKIWYPYNKHALVHHDIFKADETYHLIHEHDKQTIPMAWWNGFVLIAIGVLPILCMTFAFNFHWFIISLACIIAMGGYYGAYEYMHWCMHLKLPKRPPRFIERSRIFIYLNGHHLLHHKYQGRNFNVVLPLADLCMRTLMLEAPKEFKQATGPSVPNVQPKEPVPVREKRKRVFLEYP